MKIVFFGSSRYAVPVLDMLFNNFDLALAITTEQGSQDPIPFFCKAKKIDFVSLRKSADLIASPSLVVAMASLGVVADFGLIIPEDTLKSFSMGIINVHPSLLPKYRGATPAQNAILNGDKKTGVTIIQLDKYVDHGPIIAQVEEEIKSEDTAKDLYERLFKKGALLLEKVLPILQTTNITLKPQNHEEATFTKMLKKEDGFVDLKKKSSEIDFFNRMVRAYYPWPGVWTKLKLNPTDEEKTVKFLPNKKIQVEGGKEMAYEDFINGYEKADKTLLDFLKKEI